MAAIKKVGIVGIGCISPIYLKNISQVFQNLEVYAVCDRIRERAEKAQREYNVPKLYDTMEDLFADPQVDIVLNLTRPYEHFDVTRAALLAGKHVYSEKPLGISFEEGKELVDLAQKTGCLLGGAPDTFLGAGIQTCRRVIDDGIIGAPIGARACMIGHGPESWHPDPEFFYQNGGGPMFDMGPYYVTALINLLGGVSKVTGVARSAFTHRTITSSPFFGKEIPVQVPTYQDAILHFDSGITGSLFTTFDVYRYSDPAHCAIEIYGSEGTLMVPDPNQFTGPVRLYRPEDGELREIPLLFDYKENSRSLGLSDFASAIENGRPGRTTWKQTLHVLEILDAVKKSSDAQRTLDLTTHFEREAPMAHLLLHGVLD